MDLLLEYMHWIMPFLVAAGGAVAIVLLMFFVSSLSPRWSAAKKLAVIMSAAFIGESVFGALSGRLLYSDLEISRNPWLAYQIIDSTVGSWVKKAAVACMLAVSGGELITWLLGRIRMHRAVQGLYASFFLYYLAMLWVSAVFGVVREFSQSWFYAPIVFAAIALLAPEGLRGAAGYLRWVLAFGLLLGLLPALVDVKRVFETGYEASLIGLSYRLHGAASHANSFGAVALIYLLLEISPWGVRRVNWIGVAFSFALLVLAQSKANWVALVLCAPLVRADLSARLWRRHGGSLVLVTGLGLTALALYIARAGVPDSLDWHPGELGSQEAFTGRGAIWAITWDTFLKNPVFGYGPALWDPVFRREFNWSVAGHAHNQLLQVLGQAGLFGAASWLLLMVKLGRGVLAAQGEAHRLGLALFVALLCRAWTEAPMEAGAIAGIDGLGYLLAFAFAAAGLASAGCRVSAGASLQAAA